MRRGREVPGSRAKPFSRQDAGKLNHDQAGLRDTNRSIDRREEILEAFKTAPSPERDDSGRNREKRQARAIGGLFSSIISHFAFSVLNPCGRAVGRALNCGKFCFLRAGFYLDTENLFLARWQNTLNRFNPVRNSEPAFRERESFSHSEPRAVVEKMKRHGIEKK
jgi:hypothetical protein